MITIYPNGKINLDLTLNSGQCFRWKKIDDDTFDGVVGNDEVTVKSDGEKIEIFGVGEEKREKFTDYFDCRADYAEYLSRIKTDPVLCDCLEKYSTIRILNQPIVETLFSFIISQCNNIERIKKIVESLCENFGEETNGKRKSFPTVEKLASLDENDLKVIRCGFRDKYIIDASRKISDGTVDLSALKKMNVFDAQKELMKINGVGKKVADCTLLFSCGHIEAFPVDVHIKRFVEKNYPDGKILAVYDDIKGLAQQYMFVKDLGL